MSTPRGVTRPTGVEASTLSTARGEFAALVAGSGAGRPTIVLVPGWTGSKDDFADLLALLAEHGWHAVSYDQRGQYETAGGTDADYSLPALAADACAVAAEVAPGVAVDLLGHSFGGLVAQQAVLAAPERWRSLTLLCSGPGAFVRPAKVELLRATVEALETLPLEQVYEAKVDHDRRRPRPGGPPPQEVDAFLRRRFVRNSRASLVAITRHLLEAPDLVDAVAEVDVPVHVVYGEDDDGWPIEVQQRMAQRLGVPAQVVTGAAHSPNVENPQATADLLRALLGGSALAGVRHGVAPRR